MTRTQLTDFIRRQGSYLCIGLDTEYAKLPAPLQASSLTEAEAMLTFNRAVIEQTADCCVAYKVNTAFYEALGAEGWELMQATFDLIPDTHFKIADAKRGDIGNTSHQYARAFFEQLKVDAVTVAPYMGEDSVRPFLEYQGKWTIVLGLTSNPGSADFQRLKLDPGQWPAPLVPNVVQGKRSQLLYEQVLKTVSEWGSPDNLMYVIGATQASELGHIRTLIPEHFLLVPGVGAQGGSLNEVSKAGLNAGVGLLVNASRAVIYASAGEDYADAARNAAQAYREEMKSFLE